MKDADNWDFILNTVETMFISLADGIAGRADMSSEDAHEGLWESFEQGCFRLRCGDDDSVGHRALP